MSTVLSQQIITNSTAEVDSYITKANGYFSELQSAIDTLIASGFIGEGADGYKIFFDTKIVPTLTTNLTEGDSSLMGALKKMMEEIGTQFLDVIDHALGDANQNAGQ